MKRSLSLILAILLTLSCLVVGASVTASAETPEGTGINDLSALNGSSGTFYLTENITVSESVASFSGTLDGNGKTITTSVPVFAALSGATIKNLTIAGTDGTITITDTAQAAALAQSGSGTITLSDITNNANIVVNMTTSTYAGALIAQMAGTKLIATNCTNNGNITFHNDQNVSSAGGLFGQSTVAVELTNCVNNGNLSADTAKTTLIGGVIGEFKGVSTLTDCENTGSVKSSTTKAGGGHKIGGIASVPNGTLTFTRCVNRGEIYGARVAGGIVSQAYGSLTLDDCKNYGTVSVGMPTSATNVYVMAAGGMVGFLSTTNGATISGCVNETTGEISALYTTAQIESDAGGMVGYVDLKVNLTLNENCVNKAPVFAIRRAGGLVGWNTGSNQLTVSACENTGAITAGKADTTKDIEAWAGGLVGYLGNGDTTQTISDCVNRGVITARYNNTKTVSTAGGFVGMINNTNESATKTGATEIRNVVNYGAVHSYANAAGIVGDTRKDLTLENCINLAAITAKNDSGLTFNSYAGGMNAYSNATVNFNMCANYGEIFTQNSGLMRAGGIGAIGGNASSSYTNLANYGNVTGKDQVGGILASYSTPANVHEVATFGTITSTNGSANCRAIIGTNATIPENSYGTIAPDSTYQGANAAATCFGLNFGGGTWILREGYPELAFVETVLGSKEKSADPTVVYKGVQQTAVSDGKFAIRVVEGVVVPDLVNNNPFQYVGMEIIFAKAGDAAVKGANRYSRYVYTSILAGTDANGIPSAWGGSTETDAGWVDGTFYSALTVTEIPAEGTYTVIVRPYTTSAEGEHTKSYGDAYAFLCTDGVIVADSTYLFAAPARTN